MVRTRFAPSPTGELHLGGARTALFNYLLAKKKQGKFILRVEDTDLKRSNWQFACNQYEDLLWLGLKPDESPFGKEQTFNHRQSQRLEIYQNYLKQLLTEKKAYYCFCSEKDLEQERKDYIEKNQRANYQYSRKCLKLDYQIVQRLLQEKKKYLVRFQVNQTTDYCINDLVRGTITFPGKDIEDFVLCRSNGMPLLNLVVTIDDYLMKISHVLRGEEHLTNTVKQLVLYQAFNWESPQFGHLSIIFNQAGKKLSKRDEGTSEYQTINKLREKGYLPTAIINYLLFLGWHPKTKQEFFSLKEATEYFDLTGLNPRSPIFSVKKLNWFNKHYIQELTDEKYKEKAWKILEKYYCLSGKQKEYVEEISLLFRQQINNFQELTSLTDYFFQYLSNSVEDEHEKIWEEFKEQIRKISSWEEKTIKTFLEEFFLDKKKFLPLLRKKITGKKTGPELVKIIRILGKEKVLQHLINNKH